jgi:GntR family transcriptional regulator, transcriptional repressor for pyruvate dehydrogenase complex
VREHSVTERVRAYLLHAHLRPGERLPSERSLAAEIGVSRPALREAMRRLVQLGAVEVRRGDGSYIREVDLREGLMVRRRLEPLAAELAAQRRDERDLEQLRMLLADLTKSIDDSERFAEIDAQIHTAVTNASHNRVLVQTLLQLTELLAISRAATSGITAVRRHTLRELEILIRAIERRRASDAGRAMDRHLGRIGDILDNQRGMPDGTGLLRGS